MCLATEKKSVQSENKTDPEIVALEFLQIRTIVNPMTLYLNKAFLNSYCRPYQHFL
jgi:hypothetical protein